jgi:hypothetical protein
MGTDNRRAVRIWARIDAMRRTKRGCRQSGGLISKLQLQPPLCLLLITQTHNTIR